MANSPSTNQDKPTEITLRLTGDFRRRLGMHQARFAFPGATLRRLVAALVREFDLDDLLMAGDEPRPYVQVVINGRFSYLVGGLEAKIPDGSTVVLFACGGVLTPVPLPPGTTLRDLRARPRRE
jgi:molybdopterin converting factor small subunit